MRHGDPRLEVKVRGGRCYELAARGQLNAPSWVLVHGEVTFSSVRLAHAWLETARMVYDSTLDKKFGKLEYRSRFHSLAFHRYDAKEAAKLMARHRDYGPWDSSSKDKMVAEERDRQAAIAAAAPFIKEALSAMGPCPRDTGEIK